MTEAERMLELALERGALRYGNFTLSSGLRTSYYMDGRLLTLDPEGACLVGKTLMDILRPLGIKRVGGPTVSAVPIVTAVSMTSHMSGDPITSFIVRKEVKGHGTERLIEGDMPMGEKVAIVDDVCTTGSSVFHAIEAVEEAGCEVVKVVILVDRCQGGSDELRRRGYDLVCLMQATPDGVVEVNPRFTQVVD